MLGGFSVSEVAALSMMGEDIRFWLTVMVGLAIKFVLSEDKATRKKTLAGIVTGVACAYYGTDYVMASFGSIDSSNKDFVIIGLVITGEHFMRALVARGPEIVSSIASSIGPIKGDKL